MLNIALFYAAVAVFYFAVQFARSRLSAEPEYVPPPTIDVVFIVRVFTQRGRWAIVLDNSQYYYRLPMLIDVDENIDLGARPSIAKDFVAESGRRTRLVVFSAVDSLSLPRMLPAQNVTMVDADKVVDMIVNGRGELSVTACSYMTLAQAEILRLTAVPNFGWFTGK